MNDNADIHLSDLISIDTLKEIQEAFSNLTGMASMTTDADGVPLTKSSTFRSFCRKHTQKSYEGNLLCQHCHVTAAESFLEEGEIGAQPCHAGILEFAAPIIANGKFVGGFIGGQILTAPPDEEKIRALAKKLDIDPDEYYEAAKQVPVVSQKEIDAAASFMCTIANVLSDMAYGKYIAIQGSYEIERAAKMKSDFLANMSHEIRTPMNAVIGMAELALRENLTPVARNYINQIKTSGQALLEIINDVLDFSKIESGKMEINVDEYETYNLFIDVANIIMTRLENKDVELLVNLSPDMPEMLIGDSGRIRQILINLMNNAVKFTHHGYIRLDVNFVKVDPDEGILEVSVEDSGIGIKEENLEKIFQSFQQVDTKRNRNVEGSGLGLTISKLLLSLMDGDLNVKSIYDEGSKFYFHVPQEIASTRPGIIINNPDKIFTGALIRNAYVKQQFTYDIKNLKVEGRILKMGIGLETGITALKNVAGSKRIFLFIEQGLFGEAEQEIIRKHREIIVIVMADFSSALKYDLQNVFVVRKPLNAATIAMMLNQEEGMAGTGAEAAADTDFGFTAPDAKILVVDDNAINITVATGLLEPLQMNVDSATSGRDALGKIQKEHYDLIFMDHMMPEMDGVECTTIIRQKYPAYADTPIIALTANAVGNAKDMFLRSGMNDFVAKPIELRTIIAKIRQWLPPKKIQRNSGIAASQFMDDDIKGPTIGDLDTKKAMKLVGNEKLFWTILKEYYRVIGNRAMSIKQAEANEDWLTYTIEVHALKSSSKQIGAMALSEKAARLEKAGNEQDAQTIHALTPELLRLYGAYIPILQPFCESDDTKDQEKSEIEPEKLSGLLDKIVQASEDLDMDAMEEVSAELLKYKFEGEENELMHQLSESVQDVDVEKLEIIAGKWKSLLSQQ